MRRLIVWGDVVSNNCVDNGDTVDERSEFCSDRHWKHSWQHGSTNVLQDCPIFTHVFRDISAVSEDVSSCSLTFWPLIVKMTYCRLFIPSVSYVELTTLRDLAGRAYLAATLFFEGALDPPLHLGSLCPLFPQMLQMCYLNGQFRAKCKSPHSQQGDGGFLFWDFLGIFFLCVNSSILRTLAYSSVLFWIMLVSLIYDLISVNFSWSLLNTSDLSMIQKVTTRTQKISEQLWRCHLQLIIQHYVHFGD